MAVVVADRIERPPSLFDTPDASAAPAPARDRGGLERRLLHEREESARERREAREAATARRAGQAHGGVGGEPTLDEVLLGAWEGLIAQAAVQCPVCEGTLRPVFGEGPAEAVVEGHCDRCATTLS